MNVFSPITSFRTPQELEAHLYKQVQDKITRIFAESKFNVGANQALVHDGLKMANGVITHFSELALLENRHNELELRMDRVSEVIASHIMTTARLLIELKTYQGIVTSNEEEVAKQKSLHQKTAEKIQSTLMNTTQRLQSIVSPFFDGSTLADDREIEGKNNRLRRANKLFQKTESLRMKQLIEQREASMDLMRKYIAIAEEKGCTPDKVTAEDLAAFERKENEQKERIRQQHIDDLLSSIDSKPKSAKSNKNRKGTKKTAAKVSSTARKTLKKKNAPPQAFLLEARNESLPARSQKKQPEQGSRLLAKQGKKVSQPRQTKGNDQKEILDARCAFVLRLHKAMIFQMPRVHRWRTKDLQKIRGFTDRNKEGLIVKKYAFLLDEEISRQRCFHYLPGTEKLLDRDYRGIYTFPTERGCGMYASLFRNGSESTGFVYFGEGKMDRKVYHKYFEDKPHDVKNFASLFKHREEFDQPDDEGGEWESDGPCQFDIDSHGVLTIQFTKEDHYILIYPLRKDLLPNFFDQ